MNKQIERAINTVTKQCLAALDSGKGPYKDNTCKNVNELLDCIGKYEALLMDSQHVTVSINKWRKLYAKLTVIEIVISIPEIIMEDLAFRSCKSVKACR